MNIGIIGGADGPTSVIVTTSLNPLTLVGMVVIAVALIGFVIWRKTRNK